jgi:hypothetical protein
VPDFLVGSPSGFYVSVLARGDWGERGGTEAQFIWAARTAARQPTVPTRVAYAQATVITGVVNRYVWLPGSVTAGGDPNSLVILQGRAGGSDPWYTVGSTRSDSAGRYRFSIPAPGTRQYRLVTPDVSGLHPTFGFTDVARTTVTTYRLLSAKFLDPTATYRQKVTAYVRVSPAAAPRATLQRWTGSAWAGVKSVQLSRGIGSYTFTAVQRGTTAYRFVVPSTTYAGRPITGITTTTFRLTTR